MLRRIEELLQSIGLDLVKLLKNLTDLPNFYRKYRELKIQKGQDNLFPFGKLYPRLREWKEQGGTASGHYFHQDLLVASFIYENQPKRHIDVGSRIDGFVAHVASYREIEIIDIRNITSKSKNIKFMQADLMSDQFYFSEKTPSLSCLHAIEHFGLGRYGDPMDLDGHKKGIKNLVSCLSERGTLYLSTPIGRPRIEFNAHRVFDIHYLMEIFSSHHLKLKSFSFVNDSGELIEDVDLQTDEGKKNFNLEYGCGIFELIKE
jgi:hypothetical protein